MGEGGAGHRPCLDAPFSTSSSVGLWITVLFVLFGTFGGEGVLSVLIGVEINSPKSPKSTESSSFGAGIKLGLFETGDRREVVVDTLVEGDPMSYCGSNGERGGVLRPEGDDGDRKFPRSSKPRLGVGGKGL